MQSESALGYASAAREAEMRGDYARAISLWTQAGQYGDACRVVLAQVQSEKEISGRLKLFSQATAIAPIGDAARAEAWWARARFLLDQQVLAQIPADSRASELLEIVVGLRETGLGALASEAYEMLLHFEPSFSTRTARSDLTGVLYGELSKVRRAQKRYHYEYARDLISLGLRRLALEFIESMNGQPLIPELSALAELLCVQRPTIPAHVSTITANRVELICGENVILGRTEGALVVEQPMISKRHLEFFRRAGAPWIRDLGGRNGTSLNGVKITELEVGAGVDVLLGLTFPAAIRHDPAGGLRVELPSRSCWLPLGPLQYGNSRAHLSYQNGWLAIEPDLSKESFTLNDIAISTRVELVSGDEVFDTNKRLVLRVEPVITAPL